MGDADGTGTAARFNNPVGLAIDSTFTLYVADTYNNTIRTISTKRIISATAAGTIDVAGTAVVVVTDSALTGSPITVNVDVASGDTASTWAVKVATALQGNATIAARYTASSSGAVVFLSYIASDDQNPANLSLANGTCTGITPAPTSVASAPSGTVRTLAGSAGISGVFDGTGIFALFNQPQGISVDSSTNVYVADTGNNSIRKITTRGLVTTIAGISGITGSRDGAGSTALFNQPQGIIAGNILVILDTGNSSLRSYSFPNALVSTLPLKAPSTTTPATTTSSSGGGAPSGWFLAALSLLAAGRLLQKRRALGQAA